MPDTAAPRAAAAFFLLVLVSRRAHQVGHHGPRHRRRGGAEERGRAACSGLRRRRPTQVRGPALCCTCCTACSGSGRPPLRFGGICSRMRMGGTRGRTATCRRRSRAEPSLPAPLPACRPPRSQEDIANRRSMADARAAERAFFEAHPEYLEVSSQVAPAQRAASLALCPRGRAGHLADCMPG